MTPPVLRVVVADDERPARRFLVGLLKTCRGVEVVGEAANGEDALAAITAHAPDLALLDLQMPGMTGLEVARRLPAANAPRVAFVTAFDDHAIEAFELNAIDYLLKPVQQDRLQRTLDRARDGLRQRDAVAAQPAALAAAQTAIDRSSRRQYADRLPLRHRDAVVLVPVRTIASVEAEGELLHIRTAANETYTVTHRLHALEDRLDARRFLRLGRSTLANVDHITRVNPMPGSTYTVVLSNGQELAVSRIQSRILRDTLLKL
ncbi:MAG: LytR/AlgR family response regulator transcription factor [Vicinamibacterales bacterium]